MLSSLTSAAGQVGSYVQRGMDIVQGGTQAIQQAQQFAASLGIGGQPQSPSQPAAPQPAGLAPAPPDRAVGGDASGQPAPQPTALPPIGQPVGFPTPSHLLTPQAPVGPPQPAPADQLALLLQALQQHQVPPLPPPAPAPQPAALDLLRMILTNPQLQQALQTQAAPRAVTLRMPVAGVPGAARPAPVPLGAVMNAIALLAGQSMTELNEFVSEEEPEVPEYLVDDSGDFIVDPASADDRAALVAHLFRVDDAAQRLTWESQEYYPLDESEGELDESEEWARAAGLS